MAETHPLASPCHPMHTEAAHTTASNRPTGIDPNPDYVIKEHHANPLHHTHQRPHEASKRKTPSTNHDNKNKRITMPPMHESMQAPVTPTQ